MLSLERPTNGGPRRGCALTKLEDGLYQSDDGNKSTYELELLNRYRNILSKSCSESPNSFIDISRLSSPKKRPKSHSPMTRSFTRSSFELSPSPIRIHSTPKDEGNREKINYHLKRIHQQIEGERHKWKNQHKEWTNVSDDMKTIKDEVAKSRIFSSPKILSPSPPNTDDKISTYKRRVEQQKVAIEILTEQLEKKESEAKETNAVLEEANLNNEKLKLLEERIKKDENERRRLMTEYTNVQQKLHEADRERSELLFALSDVKAEAKSILLAYEEASHSLPELKSLLEISAKQKSEFSDQLVVLSKELEESKSEIAVLESRLGEYSSLGKTTESEKQALTKKLEESHAKYGAMQTELTTSNQKLIETKQLLNEQTQSNQHLKDKVVKTLKAYKSKSQKYEKRMRDYEEQSKEKEIELAKAISQSKELEIENLKQKQDFQELSNRMEDIQQNITLYVNKCHQVSEEKNKLEKSLYQSNERNNEFYAIQEELQETKDQLSLIQSEYHAEKQKVLDYQELCRKYYESNLSLKEDNAALQLEVGKESALLQEERNIHAESFGKLKEECKLSLNDRELVSRNNEELVEKLRKSIEDTITSEKKYESVKCALEGQKAHTNNEILKSKTLIRKLRSVTNENVLLRNEYQKEREIFEQKLKELESFMYDDKERQSALQKSIQNARMDTNISEENFKTVIEIVTQDIDNLHKLLCNEKENVSPSMAIPQCIVQVQIDELREKLQACFTVTGTLKHGYNKLKLLTRKGRETIKSQTLDIQRLHSSSKKDLLNCQQQISDLEKTQEENKEYISKLESENKTLRNREVNQVTNLEETVAALHQSVDILKDEKIVFNVLESSSYNQEMEERNKENISRIREQVDKLTLQLDEAKRSNNEAGEDIALHNNDCTVSFNYDGLSSSSPIEECHAYASDAQMRPYSTSPLDNDTSLSACTLNCESDQKETNSEILLVR